ncbi:hypothetical protein [Rhodococcus sp. NPDC049939]|uniref:TM2 domain-containing protein n=1 Tax=Rhodococcus sp. NPDC049939 TaxID=3155511 RepID=UPI0033EBA303
MTEPGSASDDSDKRAPEKPQEGNLDRQIDSESSLPPEFGSPFDYDATAEASLSQPPATSEATPSPASSGTGPGWDTYSGIGNGPGWGSTPSYPPPSGTASTASFPNVDETTRPTASSTGYEQPPIRPGGPTYGVPDPNYGMHSGYQQPGYGQPGFPPGGYPQPGFAQQFGYPAGGYGLYVDPTAPYGRDPLSGEPYSEKSKGIAGLLQIVFGFFAICGVGRLYVGSTTIGLIQLFGFFLSIPLMLLVGMGTQFVVFIAIGVILMGAVWVWSQIDGIMMLSGSVKDGQGRPLRN